MGYTSFAAPNECHQRNLARTEKNKGYSKNTDKEKCCQLQNTRWSVSKASAECMANVSLKN